ncbi:dihydrodipicolinate synthase family protein [Amycolatopsis sp. cmx-4-61]|uniref:dihydrodipicolinate synthase family protein n=1 Tax=Amycolatopsis sp. cmx-4-61 TaxID=2790937 RepID=UPI00397A7F1A
MSRQVLAAGSYAMGLTPFTAGGEVDESALREHVQWLAQENVGFWPGSPATGEGALMTDAELLRVLEIVVDATNGRLPVVAGSREFPTAAENIRFAREAAARGVDAVQVYPPTLGHSLAPTESMAERFYDEVLSALEMPVVLSCNFTTGFEITATVLERPILDHDHVVGVFKHHPDQHNVSAFVARFSAHTTVLTMAQRLMFSHAVGATAELDNLQNIAPRLCRGLHDDIHEGDIPAANSKYRTITRLWAGVSAVTARYAVPRVVAYKSVLSLLGLPGGHARSPYLEPPPDAVRALAQLIDDVGLRELEGLK